MIRIILYRVDGTGEWLEGVVHGFNDGNGFIENKETGEMLLVPVRSDCLKFKIKTDEWLKMQIEMQQRAQAQAVNAGPIPRDTFRR